jgi:trimethylamine--corrinoid protein Co-methyltransferase
LCSYSTRSGDTSREIGRDKGGNVTIKGYSRNFKPLEILTEEQVESIHRGTLEVLWVTGVRVEHDRALKLFEKNGCRVDYNEMRVRMPPGLVEECLRRAPSSWHAKAREPKNSLMLGGNNVYFGPVPGGHTVDLETWEPRVATRKENYDGARVLEALPNLHLFTPYTPYFRFEGVPPCMGMPESLAARIRISTKCQCENSYNNCEIFTIQMAQVVGIDLLGMCVIVPPLTISHDSVEAAFRFVEAGFPVRTCSGQTMGATSPVTIAGSMVSACAELISVVVLTQLIKPGTRMLVKDVIFPENMRTGAPIFGAIETILHNAVFNQIFRRYGIPTATTYCAPNSKLPDYQCGYEKTTNALIAALSGASYTETHGSVYGELSHHPLQAILDDDLAGMIGRFIEGVNVNDETLAIDLIDEVGPIPGHFLNKAHTRKWWRLEQYMPNVADRLTYPEWVNVGKKSCLDYARERMEEILATQKPTLLTSGQEQDIERILEEARKYYKERGLISEEEVAASRKSMESPKYPYE